MSTPVHNAACGSTPCTFRTFCYLVSRERTYAHMSWEIMHMHSLFVLGDEKHLKTAQQPGAL